MLVPFPEQRTRVRSTLYYVGTNSAPKARGDKFVSLSHPSACNGPIAPNPGELSSARHSMVHTLSELWQRAFQL